MSSGSQSGSTRRRCWIANWPRSHVVRAYASTETNDLLLKLSQDDFGLIRRNPPLLYHNDFTASVRRFYWSWDFGYALWLRLYFESVVNDE